MEESDQKTSIWGNSPICINSVLNTRPVLLNASDPCHEQALTFKDGAALEESKDGLSRQTTGDFSVRESTSSLNGGNTLWDTSKMRG